MPAGPDRGSILQIPGDAGLAASNMRSGNSKFVVMAVAPSLRVTRIGVSGDIPASGTFTIILESIQ